MEEVDVLIIGAGPAGLRAAVELSKHPKVSSLLLEQGQLGKPIGKSWAVPTSALIEHELYASKVWRIDHITNCTLDMTHFAFDVRDDPWWTVDEEKMLALLINRITIPIQDNTSVTKLSRKNGRMIVETKEQTYNAKIVIDASGVNGLGRQLLNLKVDTFSLLYGEIHENCSWQGNDIPWMYCVTSKKPDEHFIAAWAAPYSEDKVLVATYTYAHKEVSRAEHKKVVRKFLQHPDYKERFTRSKVTETFLSTIPLSPMEHFVFDNLMLVGDAGGHTKCLTQEGIRSGLHTGLAAAQTAVDAIQRNDYSARSLKEYIGKEQSINELFFENQDLGKIFQYLAFYLSDAEYTQVFHMLNAMPKELTLRFLRSEMRALDFIEMLEYMHKHLDLPKVLKRMSKQDRHKIVHYFEKYAEDYFKDHLHHLLHG